MRSQGFLLVKHEKRAMVVQDYMLKTPKSEWEFTTGERMDVVACRAGQVFDLPKNSRKDSLQLRHGDETFAVYTNVESTLKHGDEVEQGGVIGTMCEHERPMVGVEFYEKAGCFFFVLGKSRWATKITFD